MPVQLQSVLGTGALPSSTSIMKKLDQLDSTDHHPSSTTPATASAAASAAVAAAAAAAAAAAFRMPISLTMAAVPNLGLHHGLSGLAGLGAPSHHSLQQPQQHQQQQQLRKSAGGGPSSSSASVGSNHSFTDSEGAESDGGVGDDDVDDLPLTPNNISSGNSTKCNGKKSFCSFLFIPREPIRRSLELKGRALSFRLT